MAPMKAGSSTMIGRIAPEGMTGEFFGLFALSGRATAWMAPLAIGIVTTATQANRLGVACVLIFLVLGFVLLWGGPEERPKVCPQRWTGGPRSTPIRNFNEPSETSAKE